jgi:hypothetical protein
MGPPHGNFRLAEGSAPPLDPLLEAIGCAQGCAMIPAMESATEFSGKDLIWLASFPRSGNTFFRILLKELSGIETYATSDSRLAQKIGLADTIGHRPLASMPADGTATPPVMKTHRLPEGAGPAIYLVRDGRDALVSYARYRVAFRSKKGKIRSFHSELRDLVEGQGPFGKWESHVFAWTRDRRDGTTTVVRFEDLIARPVEVFQKALAETDTGLEVLEGGTIPTFDELHRRWPDFFRKGQADTWRTEMSEETQDLFWATNGDAMDYLGYSR